MGIKYPHLTAERKSLGFLFQLSSSCHEVACHKYARELGTSLNQSIDPCENLYDFVCGGRKTSSVRAEAEERLYEQALTTALWSSATSAHRSVAGKIGALVRSCLAISTHGLNELVQFLKDRHLPWPYHPKLNLLSILVDLSVNWNIHVWFEVVVPSTLDKNGSVQRPTIEFRNSAQLQAWFKTLSSLGHTPQHEDYLRRIFKLLGISKSRTRKMIPTIKAMDNLINNVLLPASVREHPKAMVLSFENMSRNLTPSVSTANWIFLLSGCALWAGPFSASDLVRVKNPSILLAVDYLLSLNSDIEEGLALSVGLRVIQEIGWMAHKDIDIHLRDTAPYRFTRRCQHQVEQMVGVAWFSLLSLPDGDNGLIKRIQSVLQEIGLPRGPAEGSLKGPWDLPSLVLPDQRETFFGNWMAYTQLHWNLTKNRNIMRMNSYQDWTWKFNVTVTPLMFSFPFYHKDMPSAVNYAGAGRLLARELLRAAQGPAQLKLTVDTKSLLASLTAYRQESKTMRFSLGQAHGNTKDQLFFVASCYALCSADQGGAARRACNAPVKGLPDFRAAFQCFGT
ncbi:hypothetical protein HPB47_008754 [Ixodes persulcatus]|uniref:Uncharacterized protein n=1 Tax=Ixodes persulcatus TaxID=34615 RepID=A0AC60P3Y8_IXOPE|nr:hypothetical protein HPB47_008754 [Ixodes persulcatus]